MPPASLNYLIRELLKTLIKYQSPEFDGRDETED